MTSPPDAGSPSLSRPFRPDANNKRLSLENMHIMTRLASLAACCFALAGFGIVSSSKADATTTSLFYLSSNPSADVANALRLAISKMKSGDTKGAEADLITLAGTPGVKTASPRMRFSVHIALAYCQQSNGETESAYQSTMKGGELDPSARNREYWYLLMQVAQATQRNYVAADSLIHALESEPGRASEIDIAEIWSMYDATAEMNDGGAHRRALLETLWQVNYAPKNATDLSSMQRFWAQLFESYVDIGDSNKAQTVLAAINNPYEILRLRADNRYRRFIDGNLRLADIKVVIRQYIASLQDQMASHPRQIGAAESLANALMMTGQSSDALQLLDQTLEKVSTAPKDQPAFDDLNENLRWVLNARARVLARLGHWNAALAAQKAARDDAPMPDGDVVSQRINLGDLLYRLERPREALEEIKNVSATNASPYGLLEAGEVRTCSWAQIGNKLQTKSSLSAMLAQRDLDPDALRAALLCANDEARLAKVVIARLRDRQTRNSELANDQTYLPIPSATRYDRLMEERLQRVLARPDVRAALDQYGVIDTYPLLAPDH